MDNTFLGRSTVPGPGIESTFVTYEDLGEDADPDFHGSTNSHLVTDILDTYCAEGGLVVDPMAGSGTVGKVCRRLGLTAISYDLNPQPGIEQANLMALADRNRIATNVADLTGDAGAKLIWWDPPYFDMVKYSDSSEDLSTATDYGTFLVRAASILRFLGTLLAPNGVLIFEAGDLRRPGKTLFITDDVLIEANVRSAYLRKELRIINGFKMTVRSEEGYKSYIHNCTPVTEQPVHLIHEYLTVLRSTK